MAGFWIHVGAIQFGNNFELREIRDSLIVRLPQIEEVVSHAAEWKFLNDCAILLHVDVQQRLEHFS